MSDSIRKAKNASEGIDKLAKRVHQTISDSKVREIVELRKRKFEKLRDSGSEDDWFSEMCFCILTANSTARLGIEIQKALGKGCLTLSQEDVEALLADHGHRFARPRADYICGARSHKSIRSIIESQGDDRNAREWLVENIKGLGFKEGSHFLRNTGHFDVAILDRHILSLMEEYSLIAEIPKTLTKKRYLEIEAVLEKLAIKVDIPLGILDLYLWYMKTGEVLK